MVRHVKAELFPYIFLSRVPRQFQTARQLERDGFFLKVTVSHNSVTGHQSPEIERTHYA